MLWHLKYRLMPRFHDVEQMKTRLRNERETRLYENSIVMRCISWRAVGCQAAQ
jgi:hypothetical protein